MSPQPDVRQAPGMTLLLIACAWLLAACLAAAFLASFARAIRRWAAVCATPVHVPLQRSAPVDVRHLESQR